MVDIPEDIQTWTLGLITDILHEGYNESEILEFKQDLDSENERIGKTACAFSNTIGGVIVFGIDKDKSKSLQSRIIGLTDTDQLKRKIVDQIKNIEPNIPLDTIEIKNNNIKTTIEGRILIILKIKPSSLAPHQYNHIFYKRLSDGNEPMDVNETKSSFINSEKNKWDLEMLQSEGGMMLDTLQTMKVESENGNFIV